MPARKTRAGQHFGCSPKNNNPYALLTSSVTARLEAAITGRKTKG
jgi:hypothetical protein